MKFVGFLKLIFYVSQETVSETSKKKLWKSLLAFKVTNL